MGLRDGQGVGQEPVMGPPGKLGGPVRQHS